MLGERSAPLAIICAVGALALSSCGGAGPERLRVSVEAEPGANDNSPIAVAVLVVYDEKVMEELSKLSAAEWFAQSEQRRRDNPGMARFDSANWEFMPGQTVEDVVLPLQGRPATGLVFAQFLAGGMNRVRFDPEDPLAIVLKGDGFDVH